jgi:YYY domain-containing protein
MIEVLRFWLVIQLFALAALPLAWRLFGALPSRGYALAKPLGLLLVTYVLWMGGSLGLLRNSAGGILASLALVAAASLWLGRIGLRRPAEALDRNSDVSDTADRSPFTARLSSEPASQGHRSPLTAWLRANWRMILLTEVLFLAAMALWAFVRSYSPEITTAGGEKWMELTFLNGILRSERFPPLDPWLAGFAISYYYFGYVMLAALTQLSGLAPSVAFNVGLASWFALTMVAAFGVAYDMAAALLARTNLPAAAASQSTASRSPLPALGGLLGALFVALLGNLAAFLESMQGIGLGSLAFWRWLDIKDLNCLGGPGFTEPIANCPQAAGLLPERFYWWWRASRVLNDRDLAGNAMEVIDEFPFFSFLLGDMHPHVLGLPFVLLAVGLALAVVLGRGGKETSRQVDKAGSEDGAEAAVGTPITAPLSSEPASLGYRSPLTEILDAFPLRGAGFGLYALCLGGLAFLNTWDFPIYVFLVMLSLGAALAWRQGGLSWRVAGQAVLGAAALGVVGALLYLPFYAGFQSQAGGILPNFINPTRLPHFFVMFGPLLAAAIFLLIALSRGQQGLLRRWAGFSAAAIALPILFLGAALLLGLATPGGQALVARLQSLPMVQQAGIASLGQLAVEVGKIRLGSPWTYLLLAGMIGWVLALLMGMARRARSGDRPEQDAEAARSGDRPEQDARRLGTIPKGPATADGDSTNLPIYQSTRRHLRPPHPPHRPAPDLQRGVRLPARHLRHAHEHGVQVLLPGLGAAGSGGFVQRGLSGALCRAGAALGRADGGDAAGGGRDVLSRSSPPTPAPSASRPHRRWTVRPTWRARTRPTLRPWPGCKLPCPARLRCWRPTAAPTPTPAASRPRPACPRCWAGRATSCNGAAIPWSKTSASRSWSASTAAPPAASCRGCLTVGRSTTCWWASRSGAPTASRRSPRRAWPR